MSSTLLRTVFLFLFLGITTFAFAQPSNDNPCNAIAVIVDDPAISIDNTSATAQSGEVVPPPGGPPEPCYTAWCDGDNEVQNSTWFTFVAPSNGAVVATTCFENTAIDTQIAMWQVEDCGDFTTYDYIIADDDMPEACGVGSEYSSTIIIDGLEPGQTYYLQVDGYDGEEGNFDLEITTGIPLATVNFIHNCADLSVNVVDIRVNGDLVADDINFRTCTGFVELEAGTDLYVTINEATSTDDNSPLFADTYNLNSIEDYIAIITGISSGSGYNPLQPFEMEIFEGAQTGLGTPGTLPLLFYHGVTDAPTIDIRNNETSEIIVNDLAYGTFNEAGYVLLDPSNFSVLLTDADGNDIGMSFCAPFSGAGDFPAAFTVVLSGFIDPSSNSNGDPAGLFIVNHFDGSFIELEQGLCAFPDNDNICNAAELVVNDPPASFDNSLASVQDGESSPYNLPNDDPEADCQTQWCDGSLDNSLWFKFIAPGSGNVVITTCFENTVFDTQITICTVGDCNDFSTVQYIASNDDMAGGCGSGDTYSSYLEYASLTGGNLYYLQLDGWEGESGSLDIQVNEPMSVSEGAADNIKVFPNPANDYLNIQGITTSTIISIKDITGKTCLSKSNVNHNRIYIGDLAPGVYTLCLTTGGMQKSQLIVVE